MLLLPTSIDSPASFLLLRLHPHLSFDTPSVLTLSPQVYFRMFRSLGQQALRCRLVSGWGEPDNHSVHPMGTEPAPAIEAPCENILPAIQLWEATGNSRAAKPLDVFETIYGPFEAHIALLIPQLALEFAGPKAEIVCRTFLSHHWWLSWS